MPRITYLTHDDIKNTIDALHYRRKLILNTSEKNEILVKWISENLYGRIYWHQRRYNLHEFYFSHEEDFVGFKLAWL